MRLSQDDSSWKANGIKRRDFRDVRSDPEIPKPGKNKRKDTKRWCRGKVGKEHKFVRRSTSYGTWTFTKDKCSVCGKEQYIRT